MYVSIDPKALLEVERFQKTVDDFSLQVDFQVDAFTDEYKSVPSKR